MTFIYFILFVLNTAIVTISYFSKKYRTVAFALFGVILILFAGFRADDVDRDYLSYVDNYQRIGTFREFTADDFSVLLLGLEPSIIFLSLLVHSVFNTPIMLFVIYAILGVLFKLKAIRKISPEYYLMPLLLYSTHFFFLHEMTQIRAGVACGISFLSLPYIKERKPIKFILLSLLACCFHYSAVMFLPLYFLTDKINTKVWSNVFVFAAAMAILPFSLLTVIERLPGLGVISDKIVAYQQLAEGGFASKINVFNPYIVLNELLVLLLLSVIGKSRLEAVPYLSLLLKMNIIGILMFMGFKDLPVLSFRIYEYLGFSQVFLLSSIFIFFEEKKVMFMIICFIALFYLVVDVNVSELISGYKIHQ